MKTGDNAVSSQCFVINEWLLHDLCGDNGKEAQEESFKFLRRLKEKRDRIAILRGSLWIEKAYKIMRYTDLSVRPLISKYLHNVIIRDPNKCKLLDKNEIKTIQENIRNLLPQEDLYLIETYYSADASALITTDQKLYNALSTSQKMSLGIRLRDEFLKEYLGFK